MRVVFIGAVEFSKRALEHLLKQNVEVTGVCTLEVSNFNADHVDLSSVCDIHHIPWIYTDDINSVEALSWIKNKSPDVIFCFGWSRLLKARLLTLAPLGVVGFHPAALPANRGRHPLIWALVLGLDQTASTFFFMDEGADSGDILSQREVLIDQRDDARSLYEKVIRTALMQMEEFVPKLVSGNFLKIKQDIKSGNIWRKRNICDGEIDWRMSANSIHNLVRGLAKPYIGAHFVVDGQKIVVWKTTVVTNAPKNIEAGKILDINGSSPIIKCGEEALCLLLTEPRFKPIKGSYL